MFSNFKWYRRWYGGIWEKWSIDYPVCSDIWMPRDTIKSNSPPLGRGTPKIEIWNDDKRICTKKANRK